MRNNIKKIYTAPSTKVFELEGVNVMAASGEGFVLGDNGRYPEKGDVTEDADVAPTAKGNHGLWDDYDD